MQGNIHCARNVHVNFDRINFTLFCSVNINLPSEKYVKVNGTTLYYIYNNDSVGIASLLTDIYFSIIE